ncbi:MAG: lipase family protein [candidate division NC10 bacterium]|nr:lipase family protein [candidate division NC10 bacterium]
MGDFTFKARQYEFNLVNAFGCARASLLAYEDAAVGNRAATEWGFEKFEAFTRDQHSGIVLGNADMVLIAFRGTDERADWRPNLNILFKRSPLGFVHRGFMQATELFWPDLPQRILEFCDEDQVIWVTGHSLGGALAVLTAAKLLVEHDLAIAGLYTFGQPPVGTGGFCTTFEKRFSNRLFRFVNHTDAVSDAPILFREHVGEVRYFDTSGALWEGEPPWRVSLLDHMRAPAKFGGLAQFAAHSMKNYAELLAKRISE